jgi:hypothetical protein
MSMAGHIWQNRTSHLISQEAKRKKELGSTVPFESTLPMT